MDHTHRTHTSRWRVDKTVKVKTTSSSNLSKMRHYISAGIPPINNKNTDILYLQEAVAAQVFIVWALYTIKHFSIIIQFELIRYLQHQVKC